jgi:plastocyanin
MVQELGAHQAGREKFYDFVQHSLRNPVGKGKTYERKEQHIMKANAQTGENQPARYRDAHYSSRRLCVSWLATLLLATSGAATAAIVHVDVGSNGLFFDPENVTIQPGDTVEWNWGGDHGHSVTSGSNGTSDGLFNSGTQTTPFTFSFTFPNAGTFPYFCLPHVSLGMTGVVHVVGSTTPSILGNISTRLRVETGDNVLIGGFIITGTQPKRVIVRAIGPSLSSFFAGALADPVLELHGPGGFATITNDNWRSDQQAEIIATGIQPSNDLESAIVATLPANNSAYTAIVRGANNGTGIGVVEAYDLDQTVDSKLANISTRGFVQTGDNVLIGGLIVLGQSPLNVIVRAIGPSLPVTGALQDPTLELHDSNGALIASNDNWRSDQEAAIIATGIPPSNDLESAIVRNLAPGLYTAIVRGANSTTGIAVVEAYTPN